MDPPVCWRRTASYTRTASTANRMWEEAADPVLNRAAQGVDLPAEPLSGTVPRLQQRRLARRVQLAASGVWMELG